MCVCLCVGVVGWMGGWVGENVLMFVCMEGWHHEFDPELNICANQDICLGLWRPVSASDTQTHVHTLADPHTHTHTHTCLSIH